MTESADLRESMRDLKLSIDKLVSELVRRDVYESDQRGVDNRITSVEKDVIAVEVKVDKSEQSRVEDRKAWTRIFVASLVLPVLAALVILYLTAQGGAPR